MNCATKNPHWNESRAVGYDILENISLINKDGNGKSGDIIKTVGLRLVFL